MAGRCAQSDQSEGLGNLKPESEGEAQRIGLSLIEQFEAYFDALVPSLSGATAGRGMLQVVAARRSLPDTKAAAWHLNQVTRMAAADRGLQSSV